MKAPTQVCDLESSLKCCCVNTQAEGASRDVLLLDVALDNYFRLCIERTDKSSLSGDDLLEMVGLVLRNACIACESQDFGQVSSDTSGRSLLPLLNRSFWHFGRSVLALFGLGSGTSGGSVVALLGRSFWQLWAGQFWHS